MKPVFHSIGETDSITADARAEHSANQQGLYAWDPRVKLLLLCTVVALNVGLGARAAFASGELL